MSLDVYLYREKWVSYDAGKTHEKEHEKVYRDNITHNLNKMADAAGIYYALWRPEEIGITIAKHLIPLLEKGLADLKARPEHFKQFNATNGWGTYKYFVPFVENYLNACKQFPESKVEASR